jgi:hypothetical protein
MLLTELFESVSRIVYHFTSIPNAAAILTDHRFRLTAAAGTSTERNLSSGKQYYLSTTRSKVGDYTLHQFYKSGLVFELNGEWFNHHYKGGPVDYWQNKGRYQGDGIKGRYSEMEDRVFSDEPYIPFPKDPRKLIKSIHIMWQVVPEDRLDEKLSTYLRTVLIRAKQLGIPYYIYDDEHAFVLQDTRRAKQIDISKLVNPSEPKFGDNWPQTQKDWFKGWREIYYAKDKNQLSKEGKRAADKVINYYRDAAAGLDADIHNEKRRATAGLVKLLKIFRKLGVRSGQEYVDAMRAKWQPIYKKAEEDYWAEVKRKREQEEKAKTPD